MTPTRNNAGVAHENGAIEGSQMSSQAGDRGRAAAEKTGTGKALGDWTLRGGRLMTVPQARQP
jgi:hypothetical protein